MVVLAVHAGDRRRGDLQAVLAVAGPRERRMQSSSRHPHTKTVCPRACVHRPDISVPSRCKRRVVVCEVYRICLRGKNMTEKRQRERHLPRFQEFIPKTLREFKQSLHYHWNVVVEIDFVEEKYHLAHSKPHTRFATLSSVAKAKNVGSSAT